MCTIIYVYALIRENKICSSNFTPAYTVNVRWNFSRHHESVTRKIAWTMCFIASTRAPVSTHLSPSRLHYARNVFFGELTSGVSHRIQLGSFAVSGEATKIFTPIWQLPESHFQTTLLERNGRQIGLKGTRRGLKCFVPERRQKGGFADNYPRLVPITNIFWYQNKYCILFLVTRTNSPGEKNRMMTRRDIDGLCQITIFVKVKKENNYFFGKIKLHVVCPACLPDVIRFKCLCDTLQILFYP